MRPRRAHKSASDSPERRSRRGSALVLQAFVSIVVVSLLSVLITGVIARQELADSFSAYLDRLGTTEMQGRGMGRIMLGAQEQAFLDAVDGGIMVSAVIAFAIAALAALLIARGLSGPLHRLTVGARAFSAGDFSHRVPAGGPAEVADLADAFNEMADSVSRSEELRRRMVADVAHELRTPVAALRAQTEAIAEGVLELDEARAASLVEDVSHLSRLVEDLQELSVAEAGQLRYERVEFDLVDLLSRERDRTASLVSPGVSVILEVGDPVLRIDADESRISQVIRNLTGNATRHTLAGSITIAARQEAASVVVEVRDTGEGIPEADMPHIFERFYRADVARAAHTGGIGVGLAVSRRIIQDHGGEVFARSDGGAIVGFRLPLIG
jgi:two-component system sensor histidine kinase BaeS